MREATPGAIQLPKGTLDREKVQTLEDSVWKLTGLLNEQAKQTTQLALRLDALEALVTDPKPNKKGKEG